MSLVETHGNNDAQVSVSIHSTASMTLAI
jgi:hypothetical protein